MMKLSMVILVALVGAVSAAKLTCPTVDQTENGKPESSSMVECLKDEGRCYSITYKTTLVSDTSKITEYFKKGCAVPIATDTASVFGLNVATVTYSALEAKWCNTNECTDYSARLTCHQCTKAEVTDIGGLCESTTADDFCQVKEECASIFYMQDNKAYNERACAVKSDPKEWKCADEEKQSACGIKFCNKDGCVDYSSSMSAALALPLLLVAIVNAYL